MSDTRVAIAVIHGMGSQGKTPQDPDAVSFSAGLYRALRGYMASEEWDGRVEDALDNLETVAGGTTPLLVFAHSLGGHIMSNYIYDTQKAVALGAPWVQSRSGFQRFETMAGFLTFGCNIPVFTFAYPMDQVRPIKRPGTRIPADKRLTPWWENLNDKDDVLGMPLGPAGPQYEAMINAGELRDAWINVGNLFTSWNPASHNEYWDHRNFYRPAAELIRKALLIGPVS